MALRKYDIPGVQFDPWTPPRPHGPRPLPGNDDPPFRYRPKPKPGFGKKPPALPKKFPLKVPVLPGIGIGLGLLDYLDPLFYRSPNPIKPPAGYVLRAHCTTGPPPLWRKSYRVKTLDTRGSDTCIAGQADSSTLTPSIFENLGDIVFNAGRWTSIWWRYYTNTTQAVTRVKHYETYERVPNSAKPNVGKLVPWTVSPFLPISPGINPNYLRGLSGLPSPDLPFPGPVELPPFEWTWTSAPAGSPAPRPPTKRPPPSGMKEKKTRSRKIMVAFFEVMDAISENSEVINGFYEALPDAVQNKWKCAKKKGRQFIDSAGQYGIDHVDCKLEALWHNWHQVDAGEAIMNVAKNLTEDQLYGLLHKHLPPGAMQAMPDDTGKAWNEWVNGALELIFFGQ